MFLLDMIMDIVNLIIDISLAKRYGWGSFLWNLAGTACLIAAVCFFAADLIILGVIGSLGFVACAVVGIRRFARDVRETREAEKRWRKD